MDYSLPGSSVHGIFLGKDTGVGSHSLLHWAFPTQGSNPGLLHHGQILYHLSHQGKMCSQVKSSCWQNSVLCGYRTVSLLAVTQRPFWTISVCCISFHRAPYNFKASCLSLSSILSQSFLKLMSIELVVPPTISSSVTPLSHCPQSFPEPGSFPMNQLFTSRGQNIGTSAIASVLPMNIQG